MIHPYAYRTGILASLVTVFYTLIAYFVGLDMFTSFYVPMLIVVGIIVYLVLSLKKIKAFNGGIISFSTAFMNFMVMSAVYVVISQGFNYLLIYVIDPDFGFAVNDAIIEKSIGMMESFGAPEAQIEISLVEMEKSFEEASTLYGTIMGMIKYLGFMAVVGLIASAVLKTKNEVFTETVD